MTTPVAFEYQDAETSAAASVREQFDVIIFVNTNWEVPLVKRILELERYAPNWDGYGSPPVEHETVSRAIHLIRQVASLGIEDLPAPFVGPVAGGGVILEWLAGSRQLSIAIFPEGKVEYLKWETGEQFEEDELGPRPLGRLHELVGWLARPA